MLVLKTDLLVKAKVAKAIHMKEVDL